MQQYQFWEVYLQQVERDQDEALRILVMQKNSFSE